MDGWTGGTLSPRLLPYLSIGHPRHRAQQELRTETAAGRHQARPGQSPVSFGSFCPLGGTSMRIILLFTAADFCVPVRPGFGGAGTTPALRPRPKPSSKRGHPLRLP